MGIGLGIFLLAVGLVLALGVADRVDGLDLTVIGWVLAGVGVLAIVLSLVMNQQRANTSHTHVEERRRLD